MLSGTEADRARTGSFAAVAATAVAFLPPPAWNRRTEITTNPKPPSSTVVTRRVGAVRRRVSRANRAALGRQGIRERTESITRRAVTASPRESRRAQDHAMRENDVYRTFSLLAMFASRVVHCRRRARAGRCARGVRVGTDDTVCPYHHASFGRHGLKLSSLHVLLGIRLNAGLTLVELEKGDSSKPRRASTASTARGRRVKRVSSL